MASTDVSFGIYTKTFAHITSANRIHLWDVDSRKEKRGYVDRNHLSHSFSCFTRKEQSHSNSANGSNDINDNKKSLGLLGVGFSDGLVIIWDLVRGVVAQTIGKVNETPVPTDICFSNDLTSVFIGYQDSKLLQYNVQTGGLVKSYKAGKKGISKLAINPKVGVIAVASSSIKIFDIASGQKKKLEAAFPGGVRSMVFSDCGRYLACSSNRSREIAVFDVQANASLKPIRIAPVHGIAVNLDFAVDTSANLAVILCIFEDNGGCIVTSNLDAPANGLHEDHTDYTVTSISSTSTIISGYLGSIGSKDTNNIVLAVGQKSYPMFLQRQIRDKSGELLKEVTVSDTSADTANETEPSSQSNLSNIALVAPEVLGAHEEGGKKRPLVDEYINAPAKAPRVSFNETVKKSNSDSNELTLMERLQQLSKQIDQKNQLEGNINGTSSSEMVTTSSLVTLMDQALQSGDDVLLEQCLSNNDTDMVNETAKRLSTSKVVLLLRKLVAKFEKRPSRGLLLTKWLTAMLKYHISFLITVPDLSNQLAGLSQMLEHRLSSYTKLSSLAGRLDLLLSQVAFPNNSTASSGRLEDVQPMAVYEEE